MPAPCAQPDARALRRRRAGHEPVHRRLQQLGLQKQFRLKDGTLARERPQAVSLWADDMYMGVPALAEMGHLTGKREYFDDAVRTCCK
jgi:rhamnogalacturonyl hydrolase YesR